MKTILGNEIPKSTRGILYLCQFDGKSIEVCSEILCEKEEMHFTYMLRFRILNHNW